MTLIKNYVWKYIWTVEIALCVKNAKQLLLLFSTRTKYFGAKTSLSVEFFYSNKKTQLNVTHTIRQNKFDLSSTDAVKIALDRWVCDAMCVRLSIHNTHA